MKKLLLLLALSVSPAFACITTPTSVPVVGDMGDPLTEAVVCTQRRVVGDKYQVTVHIGSVTNVKIDKIAFVQDNAITHIVVSTSDNSWLIDIHNKTYTFDVKSLDGVLGDRARVVIYRHGAMDAL